MKRKLLQLVLLLAVVAGSVSLAAAENFWTSVGSAGSVDETGTGIFDATGAQIRIGSSAVLPATLVVRYNVVATDGLPLAAGVSLGVRFKDTGAGARVVAVLKQVSFTSGNTTTLVTVDSNTFGSSPDFQFQQVSACDGGFDFSANAYFIEATITKSSELAAPSLQLLRVGPTLISC